MKIQFDPAFLSQLKSKNVRVKNSLKDAITLFEKDPYNSKLNNHPLQRARSGYRSIDVTADYRAIYEEVPLPNGDVLAYFAYIGTHKELYE